MALIDSPEGKKQQILALLRRIPTSGSFESAEISGKILQLVDELSDSKNSDRGEMEKLATSAHE